MSTICGSNRIQLERLCRFIGEDLTELSKLPKIGDTSEEIEFQLFVENI